MKTHIIILFFCSALTSCGIYRQNVVNVPLMQQKGQTQIAAHISFNGIDGQAGYAITNKIAIITNGSYYYSHTRFSEVNYQNTKHSFVEIGLGVYKKKNEKKIRELFIIAGQGTTSHFVQGLDSIKNIKIEYQQVSYNRFCVQGDFGRVRNNYEFSFSPRLLFIHYYGISDNVRNDYNKLSGSYFYLEPSFIFRYTIFKYIKISSQIVVTVPINDYSERGYNYYYDFSPFNLSLGVILNMNLFKL